MPLPKKKSEIEKNHLKKKYLWYGRPKSGKTTVASYFGGDDDNKTIFFCTEPGHSFVEIYKWENGQGKQPTQWMDFVECCRELYTQDHDFSLLAIDTVDILWGWCTKYICDLNEISHPSEMGFGKAYQAIAAEFSKVCNHLGQKGIGFIFISHEKEYEIQNGPRKESAITTTLPSGAAKFIHGFVDYIWHFNSTVDGKRYVQTARADNINAGSRGNVMHDPLPIRMPMNPQLIIEQLNKVVERKEPLFFFDEEEEIDI